MPATFGGFAVRIVDISLLGCRIEHSDRLPPKARLALKFLWRGAQTRVEATVIRSEVTSLKKGAASYLSGLEFCDSIESSPLVIREVVGWLAGEKRKSEPPPPPIVQADLEDEPEILSASYLRCTLARGEWTRLFVDDPAQPADGFTIPAPPTEREADSLCRAYEQADALRRQTMRASFERKIKAG